MEIQLVIFTLTPAGLFWKVQDEFDCKDNKLRMLSYIGYAEQMGNGAIIPNTIVTGEWEPVIPESIGAALWGFACGKLSPL